MVRTRYGLPSGCAKFMPNSLKGNLGEPITNGKIRDTQNVWLSHSLRMRLHSLTSM